MCGRCGCDADDATNGRRRTDLPRRRGKIVRRSQEERKITAEGQRDVCRKITEGWRDHRGGEREGNDDRKITGGEKDHRGRRERDVGEKIPEGWKVWLGKMVGENLRRKLRSGA